MFTLESLKVSCIESFNLLKLDKLKLLALVSLNSLKFMYKALLSAWVLPVGLLALLVGLLLDIRLLIIAFYLTMLVRAARPSMPLKKMSYWQKPLFVDWIIFFGVLLISSVPVLISFDAASWAARVYDGFLKLLFLSAPSWVPGVQIFGQLLIFASPLIIIWSLFMLDAQVSVGSYLRATGRAFTMFVYNYPFFLVMYMALRILLSVGYLVGEPLARMVPFLSVIGWAVLLLGVIPYAVCFTTNFYVKRVHEQFSLYYGK